MSLMVGKMALPSVSESNNATPSGVSYEPLTCHVFEAGIANRMKARDQDICFDCIFLISADAISIISRAASSASLIFSSIVHVSIDREIVAAEGRFWPNSAVCVS
jgi:hypothetical protein